MTPELITAICTGICVIIAQILSAWKSVMELRKVKDEIKVAAKDVKNEVITVREEAIVINEIRDKKLSEVKTLVDGQRMALIAEISELRKTIFAATGNSGDAALAHKAAKDLAAKVKSDIAAHAPGGNGGPAS